MPAYFSPVGNEIDLAAPGLNIQSTTAGNSYNVLSGTSQAAPHITGVAALYLAAGIQDLNNNGFVNDEIINKIKNYAIDPGYPGFDSIYGYGLANAAPCLDNDADGYAVCDENCRQTEILACGSSSLQLCGDCNDNDASINPGAIEQCDTIDNDCNDIIDTDNEICLPVCPDNDGDGYAECDENCRQEEIISCGSSSLQPCEG